MNEKYQNKYRIPSARLVNWDYGSNAAYFVTICTKNRDLFFGNVVDGVMQPSQIGHLIEFYWFEIPNHFPFVVLDAFVVMPNHVHGIIVINKNDDGKTWDADEMRYNVETPNLGVSTTPPHHSSTPDSTNPSRSDSSPQTTAASQKWKPGILGVILNQFKRICTINARKTDPDFGWQSRFHDHIIRDDASFYRIRNYILTNPENWEKDKFYR